MWVSKRKWNQLKREVATLKEEQLLIKETVKRSVESDEELIKIVNQLRIDLGLLKNP